SRRTRGPSIGLRRNHFIASQTTGKLRPHLRVPIVRAETLSLRPDGQERGIASPGGRGELRPKQLADRGDVPAVPRQPVVGGRSLARLLRRLPAFGRAPGRTNRVTQGARAGRGEGSHSTQGGTVGA